MIILELFFIFFKIGLFTIGGGYAMIPMIEQEIIAKGWSSIPELMNMIAISESTPGPFAINIATFIGYNQYGFLGAVAATLGVVTPSFLIILLVASFARRFLTNRYVQAFLAGVRPVVTGLIIAVGIKMVYNIMMINEKFDWNNLDYRAISIFLVTFILCQFKKTAKPLLIVVIAATLGLILYLIPF